MLFHVAVISFIPFYCESTFRERVEAVGICCFSSFLGGCFTVEFQSVDGMEVYLTGLILMGMWIPQAFVISAHGIMLM